MENSEMGTALTIIGNKIYSARKKLKMSRAELGRLVDLHETTVKRYEDGQIKSPNLEKLRAFAAALQIDYNYLVDELLCGTPKELQEGILLGFSSRELFLEWNEIMGKFDLLNEAGKAKAIEFLDLLSSHPDYSIVLEPLTDEFEHFDC